VNFPESPVQPDIHRNQPHVEPILQDVANVLRRRKLVVGVTALAAMVATFIALMFMPESYEAEARLMMVLGRENIQVPVTVQNGGVFSPGVQREEINSEIQLLRSHEVISKTVAAVGLERFEFRASPPQTAWQRIKHALRSAKRWTQTLVSDTMIQMGLKKRLTSEEKVIKLIEKSLDAARDADSNVIRVSLKLPDRTVAIETLNQLIAIYQQQHVTVRVASTVLPLLDAQVENDRAELASLRDDRLGLIRTYGLASTASRSGQLQERLEKILYDADTKRSDLAESQQQLGVLSARTSSLPTSEQERQIESPNPTVRPVQDKLTELKIKRAELVSRYKDPSVPFVRQIDEQISDLEALRAAETDTQKVTTYVSNPVRQTLEQQREIVKVAVAGLHAGIEADARHADALSRELAALHDGESRLEMVDLKIQAAEKRYLLDSARRDEARINATLDHTQVTNVITLSAANSGPEPVAPKKLRILLFGVVAGLLLGFALGMLMEWNDDTVYGEQELLKATRLPYLGTFHIGKDSRAHPLQSMGAPAPAV